MESEGKMKDGIHILFAHHLLATLIHVLVRAHCDTDMNLLYLPNLLPRVCHKPTHE